MSELYSKYLFVYGTLQSSFINEWSNFLNAHAQLMGNAHINGDLYKIDFYPGVIPNSNPESKVYGELYFSENMNEILEKLDEYEGCTTNDPLPHEFKRITIPVNINNEVIDGWCYVYTFTAESLIKIESGKF